MVRKELRVLPGLQVQLELQEKLELLVRQDQRDPRAARVPQERQEQPVIPARLGPRGRLGRQESRVQRDRPELLAIRVPLGLLEPRAIPGQPDRRAPLVFRACRGRREQMAKRVLKVRRASLGLATSTITSTSQTPPLRPWWSRATLKASTTTAGLWRKQPKSSTSMPRRLPARVASRSRGSTEIPMTSIPWQAGRPSPHSRSLRRSRASP